MAVQCIVQKAKKDLRRLMRQRISEVGGSSVTRQSQMIADALLATMAYRDASRVGIYLSMPHGEVMTRAIVNDALYHGKQVYVPYLHDVSTNEPRPDKAMDMVSLHSRSDFNKCERNPDAWGIPSIAKDTVDERQRVLVPNLQPKANLDLIVMPGLAFDRDLGRLGHGKGFYDTFLTQCHGTRTHPLRPTPLLVGLALNEQLVPDDQKIPMDRTDWRLDALILGDGSIIERDDTSKSPNKEV